MVGADTELSAARIHLSFDTRLGIELELVGSDAQRVAPERVASGVQLPSVAGASRAG